MLKNFILPISLLVGTIIGAGIFSLPFVFEKAGLGTGLIYLIVLSISVALMHLMYADTILRTESDRHHRFPGYARIYLGKKAGFLANLVTIAALFLTLTAYLVLSASFINLIVDGGSQFSKIMFFWVFGSFAVFLGIKNAALFESVTTAITLLIIILIFFLGVFNGSAEIFSAKMFNPDFAFLPFGPVLFSLLGAAAIPALIVYSKKENLKISKIKKIVVWGTLLPAIFYLMFVFGVLGISKTATEDAVSGFIGNVSPIILSVIGIFGFVSLWDSYATVGTEIKKTLEYEWQLPKIIVAITVIFAPLALYSVGFQNFLELVSLIGGILYGIWGILIIKTWKKATETEPKEFLIKSVRPVFLNTLIFIFITGIIYHIYIFL